MNFVLVHGAFRGGWCFDRLRPLLDAHGAVHAPDLLGMGRPDVPAVAGLRLDDWCDQVVDLVEATDLDDVVLVGHSQAGLVLRQVGTRLDGRLRLLAYLDAPVPAAGQRGVDLLGGPPVDAAHLPPRDTVLPPTPVVPDAAVDAEVAEWMNARLGPTPLGPSLDPVTVGPSAAPTVVAFCDRTPPGYPSVVARARFDAEGLAYDLLDAPHDAPVTDPALVADWLLGHVADRGGLDR